MGTSLPQAAGIASLADNLSRYRSLLADFCVADLELAHSFLDLARNSSPAHAVASRRRAARTKVLIEPLLPRCGGDAMRERIVVLLDALDRRLREER